MNVIDALKNHALRYREKCQSAYYRQIVRFGRMLAYRPRVSFSHGILKAMIGVTYRCQCRCDYCCAGIYPREKQELSTTEFKVLIDDIDLLPSIFTLVSFFGGEPLMREDIFDLIRYTAQKGLFTEIETNGIFLNLENVRRLKRSGLHHIFVRLEGSDQEIHDRISNFSGCFKSAVEGIRFCRDEKLSCSISTIATKEKIQGGYMREIIALGKRLGAVSVRILYPTRAGNWLKENNTVLNTKEKDETRKLLAPGYVYLESSYACTKELDRMCPSKKKKMFYVSCYGEVQPCPFVPLNFGNIRTTRINEILDMMWRHPLFAKEGYRDCLMNDSNFQDKYIVSNSETAFPIDIKI